MKKLPAAKELRILKLLHELEKRTRQLITSKEPVDSMHTGVLLARIENTLWELDEARK